MRTRQRRTRFVDDAGLGGNGAQNRIYPSGHYMCSEIADSDASKESVPRRTIQRQQSKKPGGVEKYTTGKDAGRETRVPRKIQLCLMEHKREFAVGATEGEIGFFDRILMGGRPSRGDERRERERREKEERMGVASMRVPQRAVSRMHDEVGASIRIRPGCAGRYPGIRAEAA